MAIETLEQMTLQDYKNDSRRIERIRQIRMKRKSMLLVLTFVMLGGI